MIQLYLSGDSQLLTDQDFAKFNLGEAMRELDQSLPVIQFHPASPYRDGDSNYQETNNSYDENSNYPNSPSSSFQNSDYQDSQNIHSYPPSPAVQNSPYNNFYPFSPPVFEYPPSSPLHYPQTPENYISFSSNPQSPISTNIFIKKEDH